MRFRKLPEEQFWKEYKLAFEEIHIPTENDQDRLRERIYSLQDKIAESLSERWDSDKHFSVGEDYDNCYHVCAGIYSTRLLCADYVRRVTSALASDAEPEVWTFHTSVEDCIVDGYQFYIRNGEVTFPDDSPLLPFLLRRRFLVF